MLKNNKKQLFVYRDVRRGFMQHNKGRFCFTKYCICALIYRWKDFDTDAYSGKKKKFAEFLGIKPPAVTYHLNKLIEMGEVVETESGLKLVAQSAWDAIGKQKIKGSFVILDFKIKIKLASKRYSRPLSIEQFAVLSILVTLNMRKERNLWIKDLPILLKLDRDTVKTAINKLVKYGILNQYREFDSAYLNEFFKNYIQQIKDNAHVYYGEY
ncbi:hypothetical protein NBRC110019_18100 [Neptunitalea chrysea]|uniref:Uncharacterized protein n=1 Tax=Neptunitalea chrysea TaxID=1647581 RepID=A0A9W6B733_9FLAO|nr:hypothetical protein [Neptunitalea chrysea]GLB52770.1 hypothetical protein NBRC110019_18100 [Neptunitalea chrysea]